MAGFRYQQRTDEDMDRRASGAGDGSTFEGFIMSEFRLYKPHSGDNYIRILPPTFEDPKHYGIDVWVHYGIGPDEASVICPKKMLNKPCPCCEARIVADKRGDTDLADDLKPTRRVLIWLLDMKEADRERKPILWPMGGSTDTDISKHAKDRETGKYRAVDHPDDGFNLSFDRTGEKLRTKYTGFQFNSKPSSVPDEALDYVMDHPLPTTLRWRDYDQIAGLFDGAVRARARDDRDPPRDRGSDTGRGRGDRDDDRGGRGREDTGRTRGRDDDAPSRDRGREDTGRGRDDRGTDDRGARDTQEPERGRDRERSRDDDRPRDGDRGRDRDAPPDRGRDNDAPSRDDDRGRDRGRTDDREPARSAGATSDELRRRWSQDAPRDPPPREREPARDDNDAPRRSRRD